MTVSVLTLTFISIDRWYAICYPLRFKSTTSRAKKAICIIWTIALTFGNSFFFLLYQSQFFFLSSTNQSIIYLSVLSSKDIPDLIVMTTRRDTAVRYESMTMLFTQCSPSWSIQSQRTFTILKLILLYTAPLMFMSFAYCQIVRVLWRNDIPGHNRESLDGVCDVYILVDSSIKRDIHDRKLYDRCTLPFQ